MDVARQGGGGSLGLGHGVAFPPSSCGSLSRAERNAKLPFT
ncbi:hypothetical protein C882_1856 [Caenispirillum salinarum AK4]|uniref:Uncharacterized protein n=1 Tax=Caenispirillum salinarum AK4 TaxID=1238182 RepID=K9GRI4_9PROT|nr:hypothetical protein C882_1856 [Caenispirillum salinarum AK4]